MRNLVRNQSLCYYALYSGETELLDDDGFYTGEKESSYSSPVEFYANVGVPRVRFNDFEFGRIQQGDRLITDSEKELPFDGDTLVWIDNSTTDEADYRVVSVTDSINTRTILLRKRNASG